MAKLKALGEELVEKTEQIYEEVFEMSENLPPANDGNKDGQYEVLQVAKTSDLKRPSKSRFQHLKVAVVVVIAVVIVALIAVIVFLVTREKTTTNGDWSVWSSWSSCSETCQTSKRTRQRQCNYPVPSGGAKYCEGSGYDTTYCEQQTDSDLIKVKGTRAWQSSTWRNCYADYGIDGKVDEYFCGDVNCVCKCAHTYSKNSYWVMEFECPGTVKIVSLYFRIQSHVRRNTNFTISVYDSFEDALIQNVAGTECITYTDTGIASPVNMSCLQPVYGKALRIQQFLKDRYSPLQFCEIEVFVN